MPDQSPVFSHPGSAGGHLVTADGNMPLVSAALRVEAQGGIARVVCEQRFVNRAREPLSTVYSLPLPADAAVAGFSFIMGERRITGEIDRKDAARERFEEAITEGRSAALLEQDRSSLFTQELGNIPPGVEIVAQVTIDQRLLWLDEGAWEWRFPTTVLPRYLGEPGRVPDAERIAQAIADAPLGVRMSLALKVGDRLAEGSAPHSPAHALRASRAPQASSPGASTNVEFAAEDGVALDRDVVVRWPVARSTLATALERARPASGARQGDSAFGLLTIVPPEHPWPALARDLIVLLDTSGSMEGRPLEQAKRVTRAVVESLADGDSLELIEFSAAPRRWKAEPVRASAKAKREAIAWLESRHAGGGTEMRDAIFEALRPLRAGSQRQVVLVSDGAIGFEGEAVAALCEQLPASCRLHTVGVGSAVNRSLTMAAARAGRGVEVIIGLDEDPERGARHLIRRTAAPLVVGLEIGGSALLASAPERLPDLFAGAPVLLGVKLRLEGGDLWIRGEKADGGWRESVRVPPTGCNEGNASIVSLFARERVEDLELRLAAGAKREKADALRKEIEQVGLDFAISTRFTSWVALSEETTVDPQAPTRRVRIPHQLPYGTSVEGLGLRRPALVAGLPRVRTMTFAHGMAAPFRAAPSPAPRAQREYEASFGSLDDADRDESDADDVRFGSSEEADASESDEMVFERPLRGEVILLKPGELVVSITVRDVDFEWSSPREVEILWTHDVTIWATVVAERTTRAGTIAVGQSLRISMHLDSGIPSVRPTRLRWRDGDRETEVILAG